MAWQMLTHSFRMVWGNLGHALRVSVVPFAILAAIVIAAILVAGVGDTFATLNTIEPGATPEVAPGEFGLFFLVVLVIALAYVFVSAWIAVAWHRFILLEEYPSGWVPAWRPEVPGYVGRFFLLGLLYFAVFLAAALPLALVVTGGGGAVVGVVLFVVALVYGVYALFRWSVVLPAAAIGRRMTLREAWTETQEERGMIFWFLVLYGLALIAVNVVGGLLGLIPVLGALVSLAISWFMFLVGLAALTTIYGIAVEGRQLS
ncbi:MAG: hypothetical protein ACU0CO_12210 [Shimia sp.]